MFCEYDRIRSNESAHEMHTPVAQKYCTLKKCYALCEIFDFDLELIFQQLAAQKLGHKQKYMQK